MHIKKLESISQMIQIYDNTAMKKRDNKWKHMTRKIEEFLKMANEELKGLKHNNEETKNENKMIDFKILAFVREKIVMESIDNYINTIDLTITNKNTTIPTFKTTQTIKIHGEEFEILPVDRGYDPDEEYDPENEDFVNELIKPGQKTINTNMMTTGSMIDADLTKNEYRATDYLEDSYAQMTRTEDIENKGWGIQESDKPSE